jgi:hypothetical protein
VGDDRAMIGRWSGDDRAIDFNAREYFKFSIHVFTAVKRQTILQMVTVFKLDSVLKVLAYVLS